MRSGQKRLGISWSSNLAERGQGRSVGGNGMYWCPHSSSAISLQAISIHALVDAGVGTTNLES